MLSRNATPVYVLPAAGQCGAQVGAACPWLPSAVPVKRQATVNSTAAAIHQCAPFSHGAEQSAPNVRKALLCLFAVEQPTVDFVLRLPRARPLQRRTARSEPLSAHAATVAAAKHNDGQRRGAVHRSEESTAWKGRDAMRTSANSA